MGSREHARRRRVVARLRHGGDLLLEIAAVAGELILQELVGAPLERGHGEVTGLPLWRGLWPGRGVPEGETPRETTGVEGVVSEGGLEPP